LIRIGNVALIKINAYLVPEARGGLIQKKCPQSFRAAGKSTKSGGDTCLEPRVALRRLDEAIM
jgi:hypothetical protein